MNVEQHGHFSLSMGLALLALLAVSIRILFWRPKHTKTPPMLSDTIPYITNTYQYIADMNHFLARAASAFQTTTIFGFRLGLKTSFVITGQQNLQTMFRTSPNIDFEQFLLMAMESVWLAAPEDLAKFRTDKSGRAATPAPGFENVPSEKRYWHNLHTVLQKYLEQKSHSEALARNYQHFLSSHHLNQRPVGEWTEMRLLRFLKEEMTHSAICSLMGTRIFEVIPDLLEMFWEYDAVIMSILYGAPRWLFRQAHARHRRFSAAMRRYYDDAAASFDLEGPDAEVDWEPIFGSRWSRETLRYMRVSELLPQTCAGLFGSSAIFALNSNTIPITSWPLMEMVKDQQLFQAIREEAETAYTTDPRTGKRVLDVQKVVALPLLQSVYTEALRLHVSFNISREVVKPLEMSGYTLPVNSLLQAPSRIAHYNESVWGVDGHPASEFWAYRNIKFVEQVDVETGGMKRAMQFEVRGRPTDFFPFGGGIAICPGRNFAKQEIMLTIATLATRFDMEFVGWEKMDGTPSDRPAEEDPNFAGSAGVQPDRDMRVRWKRLW